MGCVGEGKSRHSNETYVRAAAFDRDYGTPLGLCKEVSDGVFRREFTKATASHDCNTGKSSVTMKTDDICSAAAHMGCGGGHDLVGLRSAPKVHTAAACCAICKRTPNCTGRQTACAKRRPLSAPGRCSPRRRVRGRGPASWWRVGGKDRLVTGRNDEDSSPELLRRLQVQARVFGRLMTIR